jgi:hypothetical protein
MKKTMKFIGLSLTLAVLAFACKDDISNEDFENGSATINGTAYVDLDLTNDTIGTVYEYVPQGTRIYARINSEDLVEFPSAGVDYGDIVYDTVVGASGTFTFNVAANVKNVTVTLSSDDILANQIQADATAVPTVFYLPEIYSVTVSAGVTRIIEVDFFER